MEFLQSVLVTPFVEIIDSPYFFLEVFFGGLMAGVMYSLVALGFVLIALAIAVNLAIHWLGQTEREGRW